MEERQHQGRTQNLFEEPSRKRGKDSEGLSRDVRLSEEQQRKKEHKDVKVHCWALIYIAGNHANIHFMFLDLNIFNSQHSSDHHCTHLEQGSLSEQYANKICMYNHTASQSLCVFLEFQ